VCWKQQDIVKGKCFLSNTHENFLDKASIIRKQT
jgi:hypothetical protein